jgi:SAM-dependent methyltransferase
MNTDPMACTAPLVHDCAFNLLTDEPPGKVLDVPAGQGAFAKRLDERKFKVWCGDIQPDPHLLQRQRLALLNLNLGLPYKSGSFNYVVCLEGIEHIENPHHLIREFNRLLKIGGKCIISTPNVLSMRSRLSYLLYGYPNYFHLMTDVEPATGQERKIDHINPITILELRYILAQTGFELEQVDTNRLQGKRSLLFSLLKGIIAGRGKRSAQDPARARVRRLLLSEPVLFGEILVVKARKLAHSN